MPGAQAEGGPLCRAVKEIRSRCVLRRRLLRSLVAEDSELSAAVLPGARALKELQSDDRLARAFEKINGKSLSGEENHLAIRPRFLHLDGQFDSGERGHYHVGNQQIRGSNPAGLQGFPRFDERCGMESVITQDCCQCRGNYGLVIDDKYSAKFLRIRHKTSFFRRRGADEPRTKGPSAPQTSRQNLAGESRYWIT